MLRFRPLTIEDQNIVLSFLKGQKFATYEYSFLTLYFWKDYCNVEYAICDDSLIIKKTEEGKGSYFMQPIGTTPEKLPGIIEQLLDFQRERPSFLSLFRDIEEPFLTQLQALYSSHLAFSEDINNFDYIYETDKLVNLHGDKLHKRKSQVNQFIRRYNYVIKDIHDDAVMNDSLELAHRWFDIQRLKYREIFFELEGIQNIFRHLDALPVRGIAVYVDDQIAGFTLGEKANNQMGIIHVEKGDVRYKGIYPFINKTFAETHMHDIPYINREEDLGISGLRKAKLAYDPLKLEKKYIVNIV